MIAKRIVERKLQRSNLGKFPSHILQPAYEKAVAERDLWNATSIF